MSLRPVIVAVLSTLIVLGCLGHANAVPQLGPTGSFYDFVPGGFSWPDARTAALGSSFMGLSGYLPNVTSSAENAFLLTLNPLGWLGGSDQAVDGVWRWVDGPEANQIFWIGGPGGSAPPGAFANWGAGQPDAGPIQNFLLLGPAGWDDFNGTQGYFVEFGPVPEPATLLLFGTTAAGLGLARWRQRRKKQQQ